MTATPARLTFLGAAGTVTGSRHFLELAGRKILVDAGLFQGSKPLRQKNWEGFAPGAADLDLVLLTHAHIDHTGYLPRLARDGLGAPVVCTHSTAALCRHLLPDTAHLQEEEARWANKKGYSKHLPALPLFTLADAEAALRQFRPVQFGDHFPVAPGYRAKFRVAGHILGASFIDIKTTDEARPRKIVFGGDLGRPTDEVLREPAQAYNVDYLVLESTYGNRLHDPRPVREELARVVRESVTRGGVLVVPAFSVGRTQTLLCLLRELELEKAIPALPVFVDSPMAIGATEVFYEHISDLNLASRARHLAGQRIFHPERIQFAQSTEQSKAINGIKHGAIIISASGMCTGGRILHHLRERLPHPHHTILFIGYQAEGTRGRTILDGQPSLRLFGEQVPIRAKVETIPGFSGHADYREILAWLMGFNRAPERVFIVHGEADAASALAERIRVQFGWNVTIPRQGESFDLDL